MEEPSAAQARKLAKRVLAEDAGCVEAIPVLTARCEFSQRLSRDCRKWSHKQRSLGASSVRKSAISGACCKPGPTCGRVRNLPMRCVGLGFLQGATSHFRAMLGPNPNDNQDLHDPFLRQYLPGRQSGRIRQTAGAVPAERLDHIPNCRSVMIGMARPALPGSCVLELSGRTSFIKWTSMPTR